MTQGFELFAKIGGDASGLQRALGNAQRAVGGAGQSMERLRRVGVRAFQALGAAAAAATAALVAFTRSGLQLVDEQAKLARSLDASIDGVRGVQIAAKDAGIASGALASSLQMLNARTAEAARGTGSAAAAMERLGLDAQALMRMDVDERIAVIADRMQELGFSAAQAQDELGQLGIRNRQFALLMMQGGDAVRAARREVDDYGLSINQIEAQRVEQANDAFRRLGRIIEAVRIELAVQLSPVLIRVSDRFNQMVREAGGLRDVVRPSIRVVTELIGVLANAVRRAQIAWFGLRAIIAQSALAIVSFNELIGRATDATREMGREIRKELLDAQIEMFRLLGQELPSETIQRWLEELGDGMEEVGGRLRISIEESVDDSKTKLSELDQFAIQAARNMQSAFADFLFNPFEEGLKGMLRGFVDLLRRMVAELAARAAMMAFLNFLAGGSGTAATLAAKMIAGSRERGGPVMSQQPYMVGERGPEMFVPHGAGRIVPNNQLQGGGGAMVTVNINAEDPGAEGRIRTMVERELAPQIVQAAVGQTFGRLQRPRFA